MRFFIIGLLILILTGCAAHSVREEVINPDGSKVIRTTSVIVFDPYDYNGALPKSRKFQTSYEVY